jgi:hypothetical protein
MTNALNRPLCCLRYQHWRRLKLFAAIVRADFPRECQSALNRDPLSAFKRGSDAILVQSDSGRSANQPSLKQIDLGAPIHLPFDQLEFRDLPFGLAVGPR